jgi:hypothetical protein
MSSESIEQAPVTVEEEGHEDRQTSQVAPIAPQATTAGGSEKGKKGVRIDLLDEDPRLNLTLTTAMLDRKIFKQRFLIIAFISPEGISGCKTRAFKVRGVYETQKEAETACEQFRAMDGAKFNLFVAPVGMWCEFDPDPKKVENQVHADEKLQDLMKGYLDNIEKGKKVHDERIAEAQRRNQRAPSMNKLMDKMQDNLAKLKERKAAEEPTGAENQSPVTMEAVSAAVQEEPAAPSDGLSVAARRRLRQKLNKATDEDLAREEAELAEKTRRIMLLRQELDKKRAATVSEDIDDIRKMVDSRVASSAGQQ